MKNLLRKNILYGAIQSICSSILILLAIPIFIFYLGAEKYGIFALYMVIGNLNVLISGGFCSPIVKYVSEQGISKSSSIDITVTLFFLTIISLLFLVCFIFFDTFIINNILNISTDIYLSSIWLYYWLIISNFFLLIGQVFKAVIDGIQKNYLTSIHLFIYNLFYWSFIIIGVIYGADLNTIGFLIFISSLIWFFITLVSARYLYGPFIYYDSLIKCKNSFYKQFSYGSKIFAGSSIFIFFEPLSKILVSQFFGIIFVGFYDIALRLKGQVAALFARIYYPLFPYFSKEKNNELINFYVHDIGQKSFILLAPVIISFIFILEPILNMWLGEIKEVYIATLYLILAQLMFSTTVTPIYQFLISKEKASKTIYIQMLNTISNLIFFIITFDYFGFYAIIISNSLALFSTFILSVYYQYKYTRSAIFDSFFQFNSFVLMCLFLFVFTYYIDQLLSSFSYLKILLIPILSFIFFVYLCYQFRLINKNDVVRYIGINKFSSAIMKFVRH